VVFIYKSKPDVAHNTGGFKMDWFKKLLESLGLKIEGDLLTKLSAPEFAALLEKAVPKASTEGLFDQAKVDQIVSDRLKRAEKQHDTEITALKAEMTKLVDPSKVTEVEAKFKDQLDASTKKIDAMTKESKLKEQLFKAGVKDTDYLMYQASQKGITGRFTVDDKGNISVIGADGKPAFGKDGKVLEMANLIDEMKTDFPDQFGKVENNDFTPGSTNPFGGDLKPGGIGAAIAAKATTATEGDPWASKS
jgi:deoxyribodipyrimidine photolyase-like uncharacterized protein